MRSLELPRLPRRGAGGELEPRRDVGRVVRWGRPGGDRRAGPSQLWFRAVHQPLGSQAGRPAPALRGDARRAEPSGSSPSCSRRVRAVRGAEPLALVGGRLPSSTSRRRSRRNSRRSPSTCRKASRTPSGCASAPASSASSGLRARGGLQGVRPSRRGRGLMEEPHGDDEQETFGPGARGRGRHPRRPRRPRRGATMFQPQGVKGVVIACPDWARTTPTSGSCSARTSSTCSRPASRGCTSRRSRCARTRHPVGLRQGLHRRAHRHGARARPPRRGDEVPVVRDAGRAPLPVLPADAATSSLAAVRIYKTRRSAREREVRAMLVRAGFEPFWN